MMSRPCAAVLRGLIEAAAVAGQRHTVNSYPRPNGSRSPHFAALAPSTPEIVEPVRRQLGVLDGVLNVLVPEIRLQAPRVLAIVGEINRGAPCAQFL